MTVQLPHTMRLAFHGYGSPEDHQVDMARLRPTERKYVELFRNPERRQASAAARIAGHKVLDSLGCNHVSVLPDDHGAPEVLSIHDGTTVETVGISLTHRKGGAAAVVSADPESLAIGIDIEDPNPSLLKTLDDFFTESEQSEIRALKPVHAVQRATAIWAAREATLKAIGLGFAVPARCVDVHIIDETTGTAKVHNIDEFPSDIQVELRFGTIDGMTLCVAWITSHSLQQLRNRRPSPRRTFAWTGIQKTFSIIQEERT